MDSDKVIKELNSRFAAPLPELYKRRIIVWQDDDGEFADQINDLELKNVKVVILHKNNRFEVKRLLHEDQDSNILLYEEYVPDEKKDNWILDVALYSEEFHADIVSIWMEEMGLPNSSSIHSTVKEYQKFFNAKDRRQKIKAQSAVPNSRSHLIIAMLSAICNLKDHSPYKVIRTVLGQSLNNNDNSYYQDICKYSLEESFWSLAAQVTGYKEEHALRELAYHIFSTALSNTVPTDLLDDFDKYISEPHKSYCYDLVSEWPQGDDKEQLLDLTHDIEDELSIYDKLSKIDKKFLLDADIFPCIDVVILMKILDDMKHDLIDAEDIDKTVEKRVAGTWYDQYSNYYDGITRVANMQQFYIEHAAGFHGVDPKHIWDKYTSEYYVMDQYYKEFHVCYEAIKTSFHLRLSDAFNTAVDKAEALYSNWFLGELGKNWSDICADDLNEYGVIKDITRQEDFYKKNIKYANSKVYLIISDAMRYEVADTLAGKLKRDTQAEVKLSSMQGIFPTITKFGMAALLPHKELSVEYNPDKAEKLSVLADGSFTGSDYRNKILKVENPKSVALKYKKIIEMNRKDRQDLVKGMDVVYIYHDTIDEAGHTETNVFGACDTAVQELANLVKIIANEFGGTNILITSDHGFLYTNKPLREDSKVDKTVESSYDIECGRRYSIVKRGQVQENLMPVKFMDDDFDAFTPRENIRIKKNGGGLKFVHGGISLQEMVVPLISYHFLRNESKEYKKHKEKYDTKPVDLTLISNGSHKITNMIFSLNFLQTEPVSEIREETKYELYFTDEQGKKVSDVQTVIANSKAELGKDRTYRVNFNLKSREYKKTELYYLVIMGEKGINAKREEYQIDIAFAFDDIGL